MRKLLLITSLSFSLLILRPANADLVTGGAMDKYNKNLGIAASSTEYDTSMDVNTFISTIIRVILAFLGMIFLFLMFIAGNNWTQAAGNEEVVKKSKESIKNLLIGLCLVVAGYALASGFSTLLSSILTK